MASNVTRPDFRRTTIRTYRPRAGQNNRHRPSRRVGGLDAPVGPLSFASQPARLKPPPRSYPSAPARSAHDPHRDQRRGVEAMVERSRSATSASKNKIDEEGQRLIELDRAMVDRLRTARSRRVVKRRDSADRGPEIGGDYDGLPKLRGERGYAGDASQRHRGRATASASAARTRDLSSRCRLGRGKTPNRREPRSRVPSKRLLRSRCRVRRIAVWGGRSLLHLSPRMGGNGGEDASERWGMLRARSHA